MKQNNDKKVENLPTQAGFFGEYGGRFVPPQLTEALIEVEEAYLDAKKDESFQQEFRRLLKHFVGHPSPLYLAQNLTSKYGGAQIYLKREDLNHTGAHKINHTIGEALLAKRMGKTKLLGTQ